MIGFAKTGTDLKATHVGAVANSWSYYCSNGVKYVNGMCLFRLLGLWGCWAFEFVWSVVLLAVIVTVGTATACGPSFRKGDILEMKLNCWRDEVVLKKNGVPFGKISGIFFFVVGVWSIGRSCGCM